MARRSYSEVITLVAAMTLLCVLAGGSGAAGGDTTRVSVDSSGTQAEDGGSGSPSISAEGRFVAFASSATKLVAGDTNGAQDIFVRDRDTDEDGVFDEPGATNTERVSVNSSETEANGRSLSPPSISADGRFVAFHAEATNLVPNDTNGKWDVFVRDRQEGTTERASVNSSEIEANDSSSSGDRPSISASGRFVVFASYASNLVPQGADNPGTEDIFVRDLAAGTTERVNLVDGRNEYWRSNGYELRPSISADGRYVAWISSAPMVAGDTNTGPNRGWDVFVRDRQTSRTERVSVDSSGKQASQGAACQFSCTPNSTSDASISSDGQYVTWNTFASDLLPSGTDTNGLDDIYVRNRDTDEDGVFDESGAVSTKRVSVNSSGTEANDRSYNPSVSPDGRYLYFASYASNLVPNDSNATVDAFVRDLQEGTTERVSVNGSGIQADAGSASGDISCDGRFVAFSSGATNLVEDDTNALGDVFVHERATAQPSDCIAPVTTASATTNSGAPYTSGTWTNDAVEVSLSARDNQGGSGVEEIRYSATGAQGIPQTVYDPQGPPVIDAEGTTTISYFATDNAGNRESPAETFTVKIDKSAPTLDTDNTDGADGITPDKGQTGVSRSVKPTATFSDEMDPASLGTSTKLAQWNVQQRKWLRVSARVSVEGKTATLDPYPTDPTKLLAANKRFKITVTTGAKNLAGLPVSRNTSWTFNTGAFPTGTPRYSAVGDFSADQNPNGAWSYGYRASAGSGFVLYTSHANPWGPSFDQWSLDSSPTITPHVTFNRTGQSASYSTITHPPDVLNLHPGTSGQKSMVRWTAPSSGTVELEGRFEGIDTRGTTTDVAVVHNAATDLFRSNVNGYGVTVPFSITRSVAAGDTIDFSVGYGGNASNGFDSTGLSATIIY